MLATRRSLRQVEGIGNRDVKHLMNMQLRQKCGRCPFTLYNPKNILRVQAKSNYCEIYFTNRARAMLVSKILTQIQQQLPAEMFIRVHRSHLINRQYIKRVSGTQIKKAELINGESIVFSRRKLAALNKVNALREHI